MYESYGLTKKYTMTLLDQIIEKIMLFTGSFFFGVKIYA